MYLFLIESSTKKPNINIPFQKNFFQKKKKSYQNKNNNNYFPLKLKISISEN